MSPSEKNSSRPSVPEKWVSRFEAGVESHEEKHKVIYRELVNIIGSRFVSDDLSVSEAYAREKQAPLIATKGRSEFIVLPGSTEDIQRIVKLANCHNFPYSLMSSGMWVTCFAATDIPYWCQIDLKRMDRLEIDPKNMYAIVEPYVTHAQLQVEAMKKGLYNSTPSSGCQSSSLANHVAFGFQNSSWRTGFGAKNILGVEWVLPNGDILRTGSLATPGAGYFCGEGPGPDSRALLRGVLGHQGSLGIVTRIAIKLFPWPGPPVWPAEGLSPHMTVNLPTEKFRWYFFGYPTIKESIDAIREIGKVEIGAIVHRHGIWLMRNYSAKTRDEEATAIRDEYWEEALGDAPEVLTVGLWGFASEKQLEYEEMVLKEIVEETGGKWVSDEVYNKLVTDVGMDCIRAASCVRQAARRGIGAELNSAEIDGLGDLISARQIASEVQDKYTPPLLNMGQPAWIAPYDFGHHALIEVYARSPERTEEAELKIMPGVLEMRKRLMQESSLNFATAMPSQHFTGSAFANIHKLTAKIKKALDPNLVANPTRFIDMEAME
jgi:glycolate oxidase